MLLSSKKKFIPVIYFITLKIYKYYIQKNIFLSVRTPFFRNRPNVSRDLLTHKEKSLDGINMDGDERLSRR